MRSMPCDRIPWIQPISSRNAPGVWSVSNRIKRSTAWAPRHPFPQCPKLAFCWHPAKLTSKFHIYMYIYVYIYIYLFNCMGFPVIITSFWKTTIPILGCIPTSCNTNKALHKDFMPEISLLLTPGKTHFKISYLYVYICIYIYLFI